MIFIWFFHKFIFETTFFFFFSDSGEFVPSIVDMMPTEQIVVIKFNKDGRLPRVFLNIPPRWIKFFYNILEAQEKNPFTIN